MAFTFGSHTVFTAQTTEGTDDVRLELVAFPPSDGVMAKNSGVGGQKINANIILKETSASLLNTAINAWKTAYETSEIATLTTYWATYTNVVISNLTVDEKVNATSSYLAFLTVEFTKL